MKKVLFVATVVRLHINVFHLPYIQWFHEQGWQVDVAAKNDFENPDDCVIPYCDHYYDIPFEKQLSEFQTKTNVNYTEEDMKRWWKEKDLLQFDNGKNNIEDMSVSDVVNMIFDDTKSNK